MFDCPGQLELYTHLDVMYKFVVKLENIVGFRMGSVYLMDVQVMGDYSKYVSGLLMGTIAMLQLGLPHATVINKMDLLEDPTLIDDFSDRFYSEYE